MNNLSRRDFLRTSLAAGAAVSLGSPAVRVAVAGRQDKPRPNIVFVLSDDHGLDGVGCYGSDRHKDRTPNMDALAAGGIRFERCYSTPLCGPTRCEINTGRYAFRTGGLTNQTAGQPVSKDEYPLARILTEAGYDTCHAGKWRQMGETPADWGFGEYITDNTAGGWYWQKSYTKNGQLVETPEEVYCPDVYHDFAVDFLRRHASKGAAAKPFYLYYPSHLVHGPILRTPDSKPGQKDPATLYNDNIAYLDKQVGALVAEIDKLGLRENTLIVFSADNGTVNQPTSTIGGQKISGQKGTMLEGGARVPLIANWKGVAPAGRVLKDLVDFSDVLPTFVDVAGAKLPQGVIIDGRSFAAQLRGQKGEPREWIFVQLGRKWYVRDDGWKLNESGELFDMKDSPFVEQLVAADSKDQAAAAARKRLQAVLDKLNPAGGKTISAEGEAAAKDRARKKTERQKQGQAKKPKKAARKNQT